MLSNEFCMNFSWTFSAPNNLFISSTRAVTLNLSIHLWEFFPWFLQPTSFARCISVSLILLFFYYGNFGISASAPFLHWNYFSFGTILIGPISHSFSFQNASQHFLFRSNIILASFWSKSAARYFQQSIHRTAISFYCFQLFCFQQLVISIIYLFIVQRNEFLFLQLM